MRIDVKDAKTQVLITCYATDHPPLQGEQLRIGLPGVPEGTLSCYRVLWRIHVVTEDPVIILGVAALGVEMNHHG